MGAGEGKNEKKDGVVFSLPHLLPLVQRFRILNFCRIGLLLFSWCGHLASLKHPLSWHQLFISPYNVTCVCMGGQTHTIEWLAA